MKVHFIGICGVAMSALAIAFKKAGWRVTGSDKGFYPPVSTHLKDAGVDFYAGWHPEKMGTPDLVVVGNVAGSENPEWLYVQEKKITYKSYPEVIRDYLIKKNSIVCAGTYGKSTTAALMTWILKEAGMDPNYMFGAISLNDMPPALINKRHSEPAGEEPPVSTVARPGDPSTPLRSVQDDERGGWSVVEGDEYKTSRWDAKAKFFHYAPTHILLTSVVWDHADVYPTEAEYVEAFRKLVAMIPKDGLIVMSEKVTRMQNAECRILRYGMESGSDYQYSNVMQSKDGITFTIKHHSEFCILHSALPGDYMADNMTGCFAMAHTIGIAPEKIIAAIQSFKSVKRRLEKRYDGSISVFDDIAHSPSKAAAVIGALKKVYQKRVIAVFEPNTGNRQKESIPGYDNAFKDADIVFIPRLTKVKTDPNDPNPPLEGDALSKVIAKTHSDVRYRDIDEDLIDELVAESAPGDVIIFLGSHGFRGMIEDLCSRLSK